MAPYDARAIANQLLDIAEGKSHDMTNMSLLKILYFAHGWYLVDKKQPLLKQNFQAWEFGPVIKVIYDNFKNYKKSPIQSRATKVDIYTGEILEVREIINPEDVVFIENIFIAYSGFSAWSLSEMTHEVGSPWDVLWNSSVPVGRLSMRLRNSDIQKHFETLPNRVSLA